MPVTRAPRRGHRLGEDAAAAADVEHCGALERGVAARSSPGAAD